MDTPSTNRMLTRSQARCNNAAKESEGKMGQRKTGQERSSVLADITNDSPIVGLTSGSLKTPLTSARRTRTRAVVAMNTPGSGEALLRGQVKTLLQMVEEHTQLRKLPSRPLELRALTDSPLTLLAPANTPQVPSSCLELSSPDLVHDPIVTITQAVDALEDLEARSPLTRSLMLEFLDKEDSDMSSDCISTVTDLVDDDGNGKEGSLVDDDNSSLWSMQVNASSTKDEGEDENDQVVYKDDDDDEDEDEDEDEYYYSFGGRGEVEDDAEDELCSGMSRLIVSHGIGLPEFTGKHIRFEYNGDDDDGEA